MSTFYQALLPGTTKIEADLVLERVRKFDNSAYLETTYTVVYKKPEAQRGIVPPKPKKE